MLILSIRSTHGRAPNFLMFWSEHQFEEDQMPTRHSDSTFRIVGQPKVISVPRGPRGGSTSGLPVTQPLRRPAEKWILCVTSLESWMKEVGLRDLRIRWPYSRGTWLRTLATGARLRHAAQVHESFLTSGRAEGRGRRWETHRVPRGPASPRIVLSIFQCREFHRVELGMLRSPQSCQN